MRFSLIGELVLNGGHDDDKVLSIEEYFDAENLETAIIIARAMIQSRKLVKESHRNDVSGLNAVLKNDEEQVVWKTNFVPNRYRTTIETEEHFSEERVSV